MFYVHLQLLVTSVWSAAVLWSVPHAHTTWPVFLVDLVGCSTLTAYVPTTMLMATNWLWVVVWMYRLVSCMYPIKYPANTV